MALWRNLLGMPDYGESRVRALPDRQLEVVYQHALVAPAADLAALLAAWTRFVALLMAEVNAAVVRVQRKQIRNRETWERKEEGSDGKKDGSGDGEGDTASMTQTSCGTLCRTECSGCNEGSRTCHRADEASAHACCSNSCMDQLTMRMEQAGCQTRSDPWSSSL